MSGENPDQINFPEMMHLAQSGDKRAYRNLLLLVTTELKPFLSRKITNESDREDTLQNILIAVHNARHTYNTGRSFKPWLYAIANHKVIDYYRHDKRKSEKEVPDVDREFVFNDETASRFETNDYIQHILDKLPIKLAKIVKLMKLDGLSIKETAAVMEMSVSAVKVSAHRAYKIIRNME